MSIANTCSPSIMCTVSAVQIFKNPDLLLHMHRAGMQSVRLNTAHLQSVDQLEEMTARLKALMPELKILIDTKGPEMRTTSILDDGSIHLRGGQCIKLAGADQDTPSSEDKIYLNYPLVHTEVKVGDKLLIDDGKILLQIVAVNGPEMSAKVLVGGELGSKKGVAVEDVDLNLPAVSLRDRQFIEYAAKSDKIDMIAHSFVRCADDVMRVREAMGAHSKPIIAKIENQQGIDNLREIIAVSDGILIARGDLTASIGKSNVPAAQELIAKTTKSAGLPLFLATNILPSLMVGDVISDGDLAGIDLAMAQGVDVMLLTNETAAGPRPLLSVETLSSRIS